MSVPGIDVRRAEPITDQGPDVQYLFLTPECHGRGRAGEEESATGSIRLAQGVGADAITFRSAKEPPAAAVTTASAPPLRTFLRSHRLCSMQSRWPPVFRSDRTADRRRDVRHVDRSRVRAVLAPEAGTHGLGTCPGFGPDPAVELRWHLSLAGQFHHASIKNEANYTKEALLNRIQGTVVLEVVVTADGCGRKFASSARWTWGPRRRSRSSRCPMAVRAWTSCRRAGRRARQDRARL